MKFSSLAERQIRKAQAEGQLDNLRGAGKPLRSDMGAETDDAAGFRIMAEAGALPREIELRKTIEAMTAEMRGLTDPDALREARKRLAEVQLRLDIEQEARRKYARS